MKLLRQHRYGVRAASQERRVPKADLARETRENHQPDRADNGNHRLICHRQPASGRHPWEGDHPFQGPKFPYFLPFQSKYGQSEER